MRNLTHGLASQHCICSAELGSKRGLPSGSGRAEPGRRVLDHVPGARGGNVSTSGAISFDGLRTGLSVPGASEGQTRRVFGEALLIPTLNRGDRVVRENKPIHTLDELADAIAAVGAWVLFLPTSSPELKPLDLCWAKVNSRRRSLNPRT